MCVDVGLVFVDVFVWKRILIFVLVSFLISDFGISVRFRNSIYENTCFKKKNSDKWWFRNLNEFVHERENNIVIVWESDWMLNRFR